MTDKRYLVRLRPPLRGVYSVTAASVRSTEEHLVFLNSKGELLVMLQLELVESWSEL
jgi:hypothetical protein